MDGNLVALLVAVVGVLGTLTSPVISQRLSAQSRREDRQAQREDAQDAREHARADSVLAEKKATYVAFHAAARRYRAQLMTNLYAVHERTQDDTDRADLAEARRAYFSMLAEMQILAPDEVLVRVEEIMLLLGSAYDSVKALERGENKPGGSFVETRTALLAAEARWNLARRAYRVDLGLEPAEPDGSVVRPDVARSPSA